MIASVGVAAQSALEVFRPMEIAPGIGQGFEIAEGQALDADLLLEAEVGAAALALAEAQGASFGLTALRQPSPKTSR